MHGRPRPIYLRRIPGQTVHGFCRSTLHVVLTNKHVVLPTVTCGSALHAQWPVHELMGTYSMAPFAWPNSLLVQCDMRVSVCPSVCQVQFATLFYIQRAGRLHAFAHQIKR